MSNVDMNSEETAGKLAHDTPAEAGQVKVLHGADPEAVGQHPHGHRHGHHHHGKRHGHHRGHGHEAGQVSN